MPWYDNIARMSQPVQQNVLNLNQNPKGNLPKRPPLSLLHHQLIHVLLQGLQLGRRKEEEEEVVEVEVRKMKMWSLFSQV
jgi:hypothetical protein